MVARLYQEISKQKRKKSKTKQILQVNPETQYEKETLLLAIGYKRFELSIFYIPDVHVFTSYILVKFLKATTRQR